MQLIDPQLLARKYLNEVTATLADLHYQPQVIGLIATDDDPSMTYALAAKELFSEVGFRYDLQVRQPNELEATILGANEDPDIHGIFIYFPVFRNEQDNDLRNLVHYTKDIEAGSQYWASKLYANDRLARSGNAKQKALLPCTPLAIVKILTGLEEYGTEKAPLAGKTVTIFNRSHVIGKPLAMMMSNDGATVYSFDERGPRQFINAQSQATKITRQEALAYSDIIVSGVPSTEFKLIHADEIQASAVCINFASIKNFDASVPKHARLFVPRVGPMTLAMCMRNTVRLYKHHHIA